MYITTCTFIIISHGYTHMYVKGTVFVVSSENVNPDIDDFQRIDRFKQNEQNTAVIDAKHQYVMTSQLSTSVLF